MEKDEENEVEELEVGLWGRGRTDWGKMGLEQEGL